jgi:hypothetical protein
MLALLPAAVKLGVPLVGSLISGGARPLQNEDKAAVDALVASRDYVGLYNAMYDHQSGNPNPTARMWRSKAQEYASQQFRALQTSGTTIDQSRLYVRECVRIADGDPCTVESDRSRVISQTPGPDWHAPVTAPTSTAQDLADAVQAAADRGDAAATAELATRLSLGAGKLATDATQQEQQASVLPLGALSGTTLWIVLGLGLAFVIFTKVKE